MFRLVPAVNVIIVKDNKILLSKRQNKSWGNGMFVLPGGHVEQGETPLKAIKREIKEELGAIVKFKDIQFLCTAIRYKTTEKTIACIFIINNKDYTFSNNEPNQCSELSWYNINNLPDNAIEDYKIIIKEAYMNNRKYIEII